MDIRSLTFLCIMVLLSQLLVVSCNQKREKRQRKENKETVPDAGKQKGAGKDDSKKAAADQNEKRQAPKGGKGVLQGKFSKKDKTECTWAVTGGDALNLKVECAKGDARFWCVFGGNPSSCPHFKAEGKSYWKEIGRALRKQKNLCENPKGVLKSKVCKKGPQDAHLSLISSSLVEIGNIKKDEAHGKASPPHTEIVEKDIVKDDTRCSEDGDVVDQKKVAEEYCGKSWSSFCKFFLSVVQDKC